MIKRIQNIYRHQNSGQAVLLLVLITVVGLTIGLSLVSRTVSDIRISSQIEQSGRAFSAAEAGIETALRSNIVAGPTGTVQLPGASALYSVQSQGGGTDIYTTVLTESGLTQTIWLVDHNEDGTLNESGYYFPPASSMEICWGSQPNVEPAIVVTIYYKDGANYSYAKKAFDPKARGNGFINTVDISGGYCMGNYQFRKLIVPSQDSDPSSEDFNISPTAIPLMLRLTPVYAPSTLALVPSDNLPVQGKVISSVGQTSSGIVRKIQVTQGYSVLPQLLDFTLFTEN